MRRLNVGKIYQRMLATALLLAVFVGIVKYSGLFKLEHVQVRPYDNLAEYAQINSVTHQNIFSIPVNEILSSLLKHERVFQVDFDYHLPNKIDIKINDIKPAALVMARHGKTIYRMDNKCRLYPTDNIPEEIDCPIITGVRNCNSYKRITDDRMLLVVNQLELIKEDYTDFYLAISSIDMSHDKHISLYIDGLAIEVRSYAGDLHRSISKLKVFLLDYNPDLTDMHVLDMRSDELIIAVS